MLKGWIQSLTTYRAMQLYLGALLGFAILLGLLGYLSVDPAALILTSAFLVALCYLTNLALAYFIKAKAHSDSAIITGLILALIFTPSLSWPTFLALAVAAVAAMVSKYLLVWKKRHIFNPAATGAIVAALVGGLGASWWVGDVHMLPLVIIGGIFVMTKLRREAMVLTFIVGFLLLALAVQAVSASSDLSQLSSTLRSLILASPILFFASVMLIEPLTSPASTKNRIVFSLVAVATFAIYTHLPLSIGFPLELALLTANLYALTTRQGGRMTLKLREKINYTAGVFGFVFAKPTGFSFTAGQFLEWTLPHRHPDSRGIRRHFTIASSPTEPEILLVTKFAIPSSSFKSALQVLSSGDEISVDGLEGEFVLPKDASEPLLWIAGGIGVTPFRSQIKYLLDSQQRRDIVLLYSNKTADDIVLKSLFDQARDEVGLKTIYVLTDEKPSHWSGQTGFVDEPMIKTQVPDWQSRTVYVSGPEPMVEAFEKMLAEMGVPKAKIIRDYFPGYTETFQR